MLAIKLISEGLGFMLYIICAVGIRNGAVGMVHLYDKKKKWIMGTAGMAVIAAVLSAVMALIL